MLKDKCEFCDRTMAGDENTLPVGPNGEEMCQRCAQLPEHRERAVG